MVLNGNYVEGGQLLLATPAGEQSLALKQKMSCLRTKRYPFAVMVPTSWVH